MKLMTKGRGAPPLWFHHKIISSEGGPLSNLGN